MERLQEDGQHEYRATPVEYPISDNIKPATYDQFISLRDTLVYSDKYYAESAGRSLIIGTKLSGEATGTIEIREPNIMNMKIEPNGDLDWGDSVGNYVTGGGHPGYVACDIVKKGRYRLQHKEQFNNIDSSITRIHSYILQHKKVVTIVSDEEVVTWELIERAVFDWEWNTAGEIKRITSFGYLECDLNKGDWLELKIEDQGGNDITSAIEQNSNWWMVEYIDLAYNI